MMDPRVRGYAHGEVTFTFVNDSTHIPSARLQVFGRERAYEEVGKYVGFRTGRVRNRLGKSTVIGNAQNALCSDTPAS